MKGSLIYKADLYEVLRPLTLSFSALLQPVTGPTAQTSLPLQLEARFPLRLRQSPGRASGLSPRERVTWMRRDEYRGGLLRQVGPCPLL